MASSDGIFDVPPEQLRETMNAVVSAMQQCGALSSQCNTLVGEVVGSGAFHGPAASMAMNTVNQINDDMQKILQHGSYLAEHLGKTASLTEEGESNSVAKINAVWGAASNV